MSSSSLPPPPQQQQQQCTHELRILSVRGPTFGQVLASSPVRAASALTCVQWSPGSESVLLAYGRRHPALAAPVPGEEGEEGGEEGEEDPARARTETALERFLTAPPIMPRELQRQEQELQQQQQQQQQLAAAPQHQPAPQPPSQPRPHVVVEVVDARDPSRVVASVSSAEDEVNAAAFHPFAGGGIAYGTKEGRLRVLRPGWG